MTATCFLEPVDVLFLRGNRVFGEPGSFGEAILPPWPSVAAGAIRSCLLVDEGIDLDAFSRNEVEHPVLGTPECPGSFRVSDFTLARRTKGGIESLRPLPDDLIVTEGSEGALVVRRLRPGAPMEGLEGSYPLARWPLLAMDRQDKPLGGLWLGEAGWRHYLAGNTPDGADLVPSEELWSLDLRVGVGMDPARRRAEDGRLFTVQAIALHEGVGLLAEVTGAEPPAGGLLRLGGDGRGARIRLLPDYCPPEPDYEAIAANRRARIVLTSPGLFPDGWRPPGMTADGTFELFGVRGRMVAAAVGRGEVVSGWDLANWQPKPAQRAAPAGSVYWIEDLDATPADLHRLADHGLWPAEGYDAQRRAEGFNRFVFAAF